jgi:EAL and modified HD-GYP domain-containing signal transduction protein
MEPVVKSPVPTPSGTHLLHVGRRPIFDRGGEVVAYELRFRGSADAVEAGRRDTYATSHVIVNTFTEFGNGWRPRRSWPWPTGTAWSCARGTR